MRYPAIYIYLAASFKVGVPTIFTRLYSFRHSIPVYWFVITTCFRHGHS